MSMFYTVPQSCCAVVERWGKFARVVREGLHVKLPGLEDFHRVPKWGKFANRYGWLIDLTEQQTPTPVRECQTKDNVDVQANATVFWQIIDPRKAVYEADNLPAFVETVGLNALRAEIGKMELDQVFSERHALNERIAAELKQTADKWGIAFTRVEIQELTMRGDTATAMRQQMEAERRRRATVADSAGKAQAEVQLAEAEKQAAILRAEGRAKALATMGQAEAAYLAQLATHTTRECAAQILIAQKYLDGFDKISANPGDKVFLPNSFQGLLPSFIDGDRTPEHKQLALNGRV
jgi:regulator of protease activity HflC (stomatin/prohibitin superfamily)